METVRTELFEFETRIDCIVLLFEIVLRFLEMRIRYDFRERFKGEVRFEWIFMKAMTKSLGRRVKILIAFVEIRSDSSLHPLQNSVWTENEF